MALHTYIAPYGFETPFLSLEKFKITVFNDIFQNSIYLKVQFEKSPLKSLKRALILSGQKIV